MADVVLDSVILHYFLLADESALLAQLVGRPLQVPRIVYDPDEEPSLPPAAMCEMSRAIDYHERRAQDPSLPPYRRERARQGSLLLAEVHALYEQGDLVALDMTESELDRYETMTHPELCATYGVTFPLGAGEAACVAMAIERAWVLATDDRDALKALNAVAPRHPHERIRRLLIRAASTGLISREEANSIHEAMTNAGFWDNTRPFPPKRQ